MTSVERRQSILYIGIAVILAIALGGGLVKVGAGFAAVMPMELPLLDLLRLLQLQITLSGHSMFHLLAQLFLKQSQRLATMLQR
jgi:hypothetical protein